MYVSNIYKEIMLFVSFDVDSVLQEIFIEILIKILNK